MQVAQAMLAQERSIGGIKPCVGAVPQRPAQWLRPHPQRSTGLALSPAEQRAGIVLRALTQQSFGLVLCAGCSPTQVVGSLRWRQSAPE